MAFNFVTKTLAGLGAGLALLIAVTSPALADTPAESGQAAQRPAAEARSAGLQPLQAFARGTGAALLQIPGRTQLDGSLFQGANCGVASLSMILLGHGIDVPVVNLRAQANDIQPPASIDDGLHWDTISAVAKSYGLATRGVYANGTYHVWTPNEIRQELLAGKPVITLVHYRSLPANHASRAAADHYIVLTGFEGGDFFYNDPLPYGGSGVTSRIGESQLLQAWDAAWPERAAMVVFPKEAPVAPRLAPDQVGRDPGRVVAAPAALAPAAPAPQLVVAVPAPPMRAAEPPALTTAAVALVGQMVGVAGRPMAPAGTPAIWGWLLALTAVAGLLGIGRIGIPNLLCYTQQLQRVRLPRP